MSDQDYTTRGLGLVSERIKKPVPLQEQTVKDAKGRYQRFHGAFTGGFSAGYFNTVGTKEGWTPSAFISSRQKRADRTVLGPEDFMDEEVNLERNRFLLEIVAVIEYRSKKSKNCSSFERISVICI
uniref:G patch domain-containing protein n=1 Tax=Pavo cristatus TaxID=9049 RepID=A0A8C9EJB3_PAVCR